MNEKKLFHNVKSLIIYTDGSCSNNGSKNSKSGIAYVILCRTKDDENVKIIQEYSTKTSDSYKKFFQESFDKSTNQKAELLAILESLEYCKKLFQENNFESGVPIFIKTDSMYCVNIFTKWIYSWIKNNWKTSGNKTVINREIIEKIHSTIKNIENSIYFSHVRAHTKNPGKNSVEYLNWYYNDIVDKLAKSAEE